MQILKFRFCWSLIVITLIFISAVSIVSAEQFIISIPDEKITNKLQGRNRISEYKVEIPNGRVYSIMKIPRDWWIKTKYMESPDIEAFAFHGAGFLTAEDIKKGVFKNFIVVDTEFASSELDIKIDFTIDIFMEDKEKHILIEKKDLIIDSYKPCN